MTLNQAIKTAKANGANSPDWLRCLDNAARMRESGELVATVLADGVLVTSPNGSYLVTAGRSPCAAMPRHCYHRCAARLMELAETVPAPAPSRADIIADIKARWPVACPGVHLADALMYRFKRNQLEMLSVDFLTAIRAAIE